MRILTYSDPFRINENKPLWELVTKHPHFCASDTLVQGLEAHYGRNCFGILRTVDALINRVMKGYIQHAQTDIRIFLAVSSAIRDIADSAMQLAFRYNIADVVESVRLLAMLGCDTAKLCGSLSKEQEVLLEIYRKVFDAGCFAPIDDIRQLTRDTFVINVRETINNEIEYLCASHTQYKKLGITTPIRQIKDGHTAISAIINHLERVLSQAAVGQVSSVRKRKELERARHIRGLIESTDDGVFDKIIVHGVHRIRPEHYLLFKLLEEAGVEVVFLINYAANLPGVYNTWRQVYSWCDCEFEYAADLDLTSGNELGAHIAYAITGQLQPKPTVAVVTAFPNLTSFTDREVRVKYREAQRNAESSVNTLNKMNIQYYAVNGRSSNDILKMYFPEQFNQKPFLSYPIGQFILGIYEMWNFEQNTLLLTPKSLCECAVANVFSADEDVNLLQLINKTKLYFRDIEQVKDYCDRISELDNALRITQMDRYASLRKLSFFAITRRDLACFHKFIQFLNKISNLLLGGTDPQIDFGKHFKNLMEILSTPSLEGKMLTRIEEELITKVTQRLSACPEGEVVGDVRDVKELLFRYLSEHGQENTSNWIVRDFEQIDGAVLLRSKATEYHFAMLSNAHMTLQNDEALPWPLTTDMFARYPDVSSAVPAVITGLLERRGFLKFSLFYGTFFTRCGVSLSYVKEEQGEEQTPYYILRVLGMKEKPFRDEVAVSFLTGDEMPERTDAFSSSLVSQEQKEMFSICPYKFLLNGVLKTPLEYCSDYHIKYFVANFLRILLNDERSDLQQQLRKERIIISKMMPFWDETELTDIMTNAYNQLEKAGSQEDAFHWLDFVRRKENFLVAQWQDLNSSVKHMRFNQSGLSGRIVNYMTGNQLYPRREELPHQKICEYCNYGDICLRSYYDALADTDGDEALEPN